MAVYFPVFLVGLALGSFLNVVITRLPLEEEFWASRSRCPHCRAALPWYDNIPLISYFWLKRGCRFCGELIPPRYPLVELAGGLLALGLWHQFPGSYLLLVYGPFSAALVALSAIDLERRRLPDVITLPGIALGLLLALVLPHLSFWEAALGALGGGALFYLVAWGYAAWTGKQGMGGGDIKLMAMIGAFLGVKSLPPVIFISAGVGTLVGLGMTLARGRWRSGEWRTASLPYGPFLALAALVYLLGRESWFTGLGP